MTILICIKTCDEKPDLGKSAAASDWAPLSPPRRAAFVIVDKVFAEIFVQ